MRLCLDAIFPAQRDSAGMRMIIGKPFRQLDGKWISIDTESLHGEKDIASDRYR